MTADIMVLKLLQIVEDQASRNDQRRSAESVGISKSHCRLLTEEFVELLFRVTLVSTKTSTEAMMHVLCRAQYGVGYKSE